MNEMAAGEYGAAGEALAQRTVRKLAWRLLPFMGVLYFVAFLDRVNVGFAALTMNADLGLSARVYGFGAGIFFLGYVLFEVPSNLMLHRFGARRWIARIMISWGLLSAAMVLTTGPLTFYVLRFLLGVAEAGFFPGMILYLTYWFPAAVRARITGAFMIAIPVSSVIGAPLSTALLDLDALDLRGWQWLFILEGLPAVLLGFVVLARLDDRPDRAAWLTADEKAWIRNVLAGEAAVARRDVGVRGALLDARVWTLGVIYFGLVIGLYGLGFWLPQIVAELGGLSHLQVGLLTALPAAIAAVAMYLWGRHSDVTQERVWHVAWPALIGSAGLAASAYLVEAPLLAFAALTVGAVGIYATLPVFWTLPTALLTGAAGAGAIALVNSIGNTGGYVGPAVMGYIKDTTGEHTGGLLVLAGALLMAAALVVATRRSPGQGASPPSGP